MGQVDVSGPDAAKLLQYITTNDVTTLEPGAAHYSLLPNEQGGVVDDIIIYRNHTGPGFMVCVNASNRDKDVAWMKRFQAERSDLNANVEDISDKVGMIAIQGPLAEAITQRVTDIDLSELEYFAWHDAVVAGVPTKLARTGYTGEDGFEFFSPIDRIAEIWDGLMAAGKNDGLVPVGLGARDTLRLEARMPLYGQELADDISPLEAGLGWAVKLDKGDFVGRGPLVAQKEAGVPRKTVGFKYVERGGSPRSHFDVRVGDRSVGQVTSGAMSPTLGENIGIALVDADVAGIGKPLDIIVRDKPVSAVQVKVPFYKRSK
jgi:aminomethyltransferase